MNDIDREEHRLAALAAGYEFRAKYSPALYWRKIDSDTWTTWQPKINKADSFDLMVACGLDFAKVHGGYICYHKAVRASAKDVTPSTHEAIFNCAVEIGRSMEASNEQSAD